MRQFELMEQMERELLGGNASFGKTQRPSVLEHTF
jgi:hypothetical protein